MSQSSDTPIADVLALTPELLHATCVQLLATSARRVAAALRRDTHPPPFGAAPDTMDALIVLAYAQETARLQHAQRATADATQRSLVALQATRPPAIAAAIARQRAQQEPD